MAPALIAAHVGARAVAAAQAREAGKKYDQAAFSQLLNFLSSYNDLSKYAYPL